MLLDESISQTPVTILTGFLGSGKTTLLNHQLKHNQNEKWMVIENEFGPINIDSELLDKQVNLNLIELTNGCICCTVQGDFSLALHRLLDDKLSGKQHFDRLIIETTGVADPAPLIQLFFTDELIKVGFRLDAIVTTVDCEHFLMQLPQNPIAYSQIAFADRIILTKVDRVSHEQVNATTHKINQINLKAPIIEAINGDVPPHFWLDTHSFDLTDELNLSKGRFKVHQLRQADETISIQPLSTSFDVNKNSEIQSFVLEAKELDLKKAGQFMEQLIEEYGYEMMRYKGIFAIQDESKKLIVQGIHKIVGFDYGSNWQAEEEKSSKLVIIGRNLPIEKIKTQFLITQS